MDTNLESSIRLEAYYIYKCRELHKIPGNDIGDWLDAERKIKRKDFENMFTSDMVNRLERYL